jgi:hypothetical protein
MISGICILQGQMSMCLAILSRVYKSPTSRRWNSLVAAIFWVGAGELVAAPVLGWLTAQFLLSLSSFSLNTSHQL